MSYKLYDGGVIHLPTGKSIVDDPANRDWRKYQVWLAEGGVPEAADPEPPPQPDIDAELAAAIEAATTLDELKDALLGNLLPGQLARAGGRPV